MSSFDEKFSSLKISLETIKSATNNFADENLIREGGFGKIYRGKLLKSEKSIDIVARRFEGRFGQRIKEFMKEIMMLSSLKHQNLVSIVGYHYDDDEWIIINKFETKGSLDRYLSDPSLTWTRRLQICVGIARALSFIHYDEQRNFSVIHRNVKSSKILLDDKWEAKLSGFELSVMQPAGRRHELVLDYWVSGTYGYVDPSYIRSGGVNHKSDVYSLGVVLFEVLCGRKAFSIGNKHDEAPFLSIEQHSNMGKVEEFVEGGSNIEGSTALHPSSSQESQPPSFAQLEALIKPQVSGDCVKESASSSIVDLKETYMNTNKKLDLSKIPIPEEGSLIAELARSHYEKGTLDDIILPGLREQMDSQSLEIFSEAAYCCLKEQRRQRPSIDRIISFLEQALELQLARQNSEHLTVAVKGTSTNHWKRKDLEHLKIGLDAIKQATDNFAEKNNIGSGGYGSVYIAELEYYDSSAAEVGKELDFPKTRGIVAIKKIFDRVDGHGKEGFIAEIETLSICKHSNIVSLRGFCDEDAHMIVIYEYVSNGSLDDYLQKEENRTNLSWEQRIKICIDIACGLDYIHTIMEEKQKIIHRDIKSANILLGENLEAKVADFGLSKIHPPDHMSSTLKTKNIVGTPVYRDPEYVDTGNLKKESDIYSFGVVLFEILSGKLAYDPFYMKDNERGIAPIARQHYENETLKEMVDPTFKEEDDEKKFTLNKGPNQDSLHTFSKIAYRCLEEKQAQRPKMEEIIKELKKALNFQETQADSLRMSFEDIRLATQNFTKVIGTGGFGTVYKGEILRAHGPPTHVAVKRWNSRGDQGEKEFVRELGLLVEFIHENIIGLVGYCDEYNEKIIVYEYASNGNLKKHLQYPSLTWTQRLKIGIEVATGLDFLHGNGLEQDIVIHRDLNSSNILLNADWKAKIADFGLSIITPINNEIDFVVDDACGTLGYVDPQYMNLVFLTRESDIYTFGVVLSEMMCGRAVFTLKHQGEHDRLVRFFKRLYEEGNLDIMVLPGIAQEIVEKSLTTFQTIAYQCLHDKREDRPAASEVLSQLKKALEFQEDYEIWEDKLPTDYKEIIAMSKNPQIYSDVSNKDLFDMFSKGILIQEGKVFLSQNSNGERNEMVSAKMFSYENRISHTWRSIKTSRFQRVMKVMDISNLKIQIKIKTQFLSPKVIYVAHLVFKFCEPRAPSSHPMYVKLKYKMGSQSFNTYFATWRDDE